MLYQLSYAHQVFTFGFSVCFESSSDFLDSGLDGL